MNVIVPVVDRLREMGVEVTLYSNGKAQELLAQKNIPHTPCTEEMLKMPETLALPDLLLTSMCSDGGIGRELIPYGKFLGIPTVCLQDMWGARLEKEFRDPAYWPDYMFVPDDAARQIVNGTWPEFKGQIFITGWVAFDDLAAMDVGKKSDEVRTRLRIINDFPAVYFAGQLTEERTAEVLAELIAALDMSRESVFLIPRWHARAPKDAAEDHARCLEIVKAINGSSSIRIVDTNMIPYEELPIPDIMAAADLVVGMTSTDLLKAACLGKPVVTTLSHLSAGAGEKYPLVLSGCCISTSSVRELADAVGEMCRGTLQQRLAGAQRKNFPRGSSSAHRAAEEVVRILKE